jgi:hypothetical protein
MSNQAIAETVNISSFTRQNAIDTLLRLNEILVDPSYTDEFKAQFASRIAVKVAKGLMNSRYKIQQEVQ